MNRKYAIIAGEWFFWVLRQEVSLPVGIAATQRISSAFFLLKQRKFLTDAGLFEFWDVAPGIYIHRNSWFALSLQFGLGY